MVETEQLNLSAPEYHALPALSFSGMKDLAISPLRYWHLWINPQRPEREETSEMRFGTALHCAVLEPDQFDARYCRAIDADDFDGCLRTIDELRQWLKDHGHTPKGTRKAELIDQLHAVDSSVPILDVEIARDVLANSGKVRLSKDDYNRVLSAADALRCEPRVRAILADGQAEACLTATDPDTGVPLKCRIDWLAPKYILDIKTFSQQRGKPIDKCVTDAIWYEKYLRQAWLYSHMEALTHGRDARTGAQQSRDYVMAFVESDEPHEVRLRVLRPGTSGNPNLYWTTAMHECRGLMRVYADCMQRFGVKPWRFEQDIDPLLDDDLPQLLYSRL